MSFVNFICCKNRLIQKLIRKATSRHDISFVWRKRERLRTVAYLKKYSENFSL